jgi:CHAD domain-containing protein
MNGSREAVEVGRDEPVIEAALATLKDRLKQVRRRFSQAVRKSEENAERIHQLRVATRRASAALDLYRDFVPRKHAKKMGTQLKHIRRAAGRVRDCDLLLSRFSSGAAQAESPSFIKRIRSLRREAYGALRHLHKEHIPSKRLKRRTKALIRRTRQKAERRSQPTVQTFKDWAPDRLHVFLRDFFQAAAPDLRDFAQLHRFRIRSKALRYAMELVATTFPPEFKEELYPDIERLQMLLGDINDESNFLSSVGKRLANNVKLSDVDGLKHRMAQEQHALDDLEREFAGWWTAERREALKRRFDEITAVRAA